VVRFDSDGNGETLYEGDPLSEPVDVVCMADGALMVADSGANRVTYFHTNGTPETFATTDQPVSVSIAAGEAYISSRHTGKPYAYRRSGWGLDFLGENADFPPRAGYNKPGGIAAAPDGSVVWMVTTSGGYDKPSLSDYDPTASENYPIRFNPRGYATIMARNGMGPTDHPGDVAYVRLATAPLPEKPHYTTEGGAGDGDVSAASGDAAGGEECKTEGGCSVGLRGASVLPLVVLIMLMLLWRVLGGGMLGWSVAGDASQAAPKRRMLARLVATLRGTGSSGASIVVILAGLALCACSSKTVCEDRGPAEVAVADAVTGDAAVDVGNNQRAAPDDPVVLPECPDAPCMPGAAPVCESETGRKRCYLAADGCPMWSPEQSCGDGWKCEEGECSWCWPQCGNLECGDDGCGGSCGQCQEDWCCSGGTCTLCEPDCTDKECGPDWAGGSCGECGEGLVCASGGCRQPETGTCNELSGCLSACPAWDNDCYDTCWGFAGSMAPYQFDALGGCTMVMCKHCWDGEGDDDGDECYQACLQNECLDEFASCLLFDGHLSCTQAYECVNGCEEDDYACGDACVLAMTIPAYKAALAWEACMLPLCPDSMPEEEQEACKAEVAQGECADVHVGCFGPCEPFCSQIQTCGPDNCTGVCGICQEGTWCGNGFECLPL